MNARDDNDFFAYPRHQVVLVEQTAKPLKIQGNRVAKVLIFGILVFWAGVILGVASGNFELIYHGVGGLGRASCPPSSECGDTYY